MAYGIRWFSEFDDVQDNVVYVVEVLERGYSGAITEVLSSGDPITISQEKVDNPYTEIRPQKASITWISDEISNFQISDLFITDDRKYQLRVHRLDGATKIPVWSGYLVPVDCEAPYASKPFPVTFSATCGLPFLNDVEFLDKYGSYVRGELSLIQIIAHCLSSTGLELPIHTYLDLFDEGMSTAQSPLQQAEIDADGLRGMNASDALAGILSTPGCFVLQSNNTWVIKGLREQQKAFGTLRIFNPDGSFNSSAVVSQVATFGREHELSDSPTFRALGNEVNERLAEPNSVVTETVNPGMPVNRLANGEFAGAVTGGNIPGWVNKTTPGTAWARDGFGTPDDPYRLVYNSFIEFKIKAKQNKFKPLSYFETGPIELNVGDFNISVRDRKDVKVVFSGSLKMNNALGATFNLNLNENERQYASYLNESGEWLYSKKEDTEVNINSSQAEMAPAKTYEELEYQTFKVESQEITNLIKSGSEGKVYIRLRVFPGVQGPGYIGNPVFLSIEDLSLIITTGLAFEGDHKYQADGKLPIRNANEVEFTTIIADKTGIDTPEQRRDVNRVMTGYMTLTGTNTLTKGWKREGVPGDGHEPIQKKALRDRIRLFCGKRQVIEGAFIGYGLRPDHTVVNTFEESETFYTVTGWEWDLKNSVFDASFHELDFTPLADEDIYLYDEESGRRSGRAGSGGTAGGGNVPVKPVEQIVLDDPEPYEYEVLIEDEEDRVCDIVELIQSSHTVDLLEVKILSFPDWINEISLYRGEDLSEEDLPDEGILQVLWKGKPVKSGTYQILVELSATDGADYILSIPLVVEPSEDFIESWPPVFIDLPTIYFTIGKTETKNLFLPDFLDPDGEHDGTGLSPRLRSKPSWVSDSRIVFMDLSVTGNPSTSGVDYVTYELSDAIGRTTTLTIQVIATPAIRFKYDLIDTSEIDEVKIGALPAGYPVTDRFDVNIAVVGRHDEINIELDGPSGLHVQYRQAVAEGDSGVYRVGPDSDGVTGEVGLYKLKTQTILFGEIQYEEIITFTLYDEEYLNAAKFELIKAGGAAIGEIAILGNISFVYPDEKTNIKVTLDVNHDEVSLVHSVDGVVVKTTTYTHADAVEDSHLVYPVAGELLTVGKHSVMLVLKLDGAEVYEREAVFEILEKPIVAVSGLELVEHVPNTEDYNTIAELPLKGGVYDLPVNGWSVGSYYDGELFDFEKYQIFEERAGSFVEVNAGLYLGKPQHRNYVTATPESDFNIFLGKSSLSVGNLHKAPSRIKVIVSRLIGGESGEVVNIQSADFTLREKLLPGEGSGLIFLTNQTVLDSNIPVMGGTYQAPVTTDIADRWNLSADFGGVEFNKVRLNMKAFFAGVWKTLHWEGADYVSDTLLADATESLNGAPILKTNVAGIYRVLYAAGTEFFVLDDPIKLRAVAVAYFDGVEVATTEEAEFDIILPVEDPEIEEPSDKITDYKAGDGLSEDVANFIKTFSAKVDGETIVINSAGELEVNAEFSGGVSGTVGKILKFTSAHSAGNSIMTESGMNILVEGRLYTGAAADHKVHLYTEATTGAIIFKNSVGSDLYWIQSNATALSINLPGVLNDTIRVARATGDVSFARGITVNTGINPPFITNSSALNVNFNADLFEGQHGAYYLNRANHTGTQLAATISDFAATVRSTTLLGLSVIAGSAITAADTVLSAFGKLQGQINTNTAGVSGTTGKIAKFISGSAVGDSIMSESGTNITVNGRVYAGAVGSHRVHLYSEATVGAVIFRDATPADLYWIQSTSTALSINLPGVINDAVKVLRSNGDVSFARPITVNSGASAPFITNSVVLNTNFNADLLDGQHGTYYLAWANFTGVPTTLVTGTGTAGYGAKFSSANTIVNSLYYDDGSNVKIFAGATNMGAVSAQKVVFFSEAGYSTLGFLDVAGTTSYYTITSNTTKLSFNVNGVLNDAIYIAKANGDVVFARGITVNSGGSAPFITNSTVLCTNLNADLLDGQHGAYYQNRANHTGTQLAATISDFNTSARNLISGTGSISYNPATGVISYTGGAGSGTVTGSGYANAGIFSIAMWQNPTMITYDGLFALKYDSGTKTLMVGDVTRSHGALNIGGKTTIQDTLTETDSTSLILQVNSKTKASKPWPSMTCDEKTAIAAPMIGGAVYQTDAGTTAVGASGYGSSTTGAGVYVFNGIGWWKLEWA